jgi:HEAT repeat protein
VENIPLLLQCAELGAANPAFQTIARIDDDSIWEIFRQYLHDDRDEVCKAVLLALRSVGNERSEDMIIEFLRTNKREKLALDALSILSRNDGLDQRPFSSELIPVLINLVKTAKRYQIRFLYYLDEINDERVSTELRALCRKADNLRVRDSALSCLYPNIQASLLLELLGDDEPGMRQHAALCVHSLTDQQVFSERDHHALIEGVRCRLAHENDVETRLIYILILLDEDRTDQLLEMAYQDLNGVSSEFCDAYRGIIRSLFEHLISDDSPLQTRTLDLVRSHPDSETRYEFIRALRHLDDERVISFIIEQLHSDSDAVNRYLCVCVLGNCSPSSAIIEALAEALNDDDGSRYPVCRTAASVLHDIGTPEALAAIEAWEQGRS